MKPTPTQHLPGQKSEGSRNKRIYVPPEKIGKRKTPSPSEESLNGEIETMDPLCLTGDLHAYLTRSLRLKPGHVVTVFDGEGTEYPATLKEIHRQTLKLQLGKPQKHPPPPSPSLVLLQGLIKAGNMDLVIQKATELGVDHIVPVQCQRSVPRLKGERAQKRSDRWSKIATAACGQCGRAWLPTIHAPLSFDEALAYCQVGAVSPLRVALWAQEGKHSFTDTLQRREDLESYDSLCVLVGPEGGLTSDEVQSARAKGFETYAMGPLVLRSETAAMAALTLLAALSGRWKKGPAPFQSSFPDPQKSH